MELKRSDTIILGAAIFSLAVFGLVRIMGASVAAREGVFERVARPAVVFWGETVNVDLNLNADKLPPPSDVEPVVPLRVALVIDRSGSMGQQPMAEARNAAANFVDLMNIDPALGDESDEATVIVFDRAAHVLTPFSTNRQQLLTAIESIQSGGGTAIDAGLNLAAQQFALSPPTVSSQRLIILLSDGQSNVPAALSAADQAKAEGIRIVTVALGAADRQTLSQIASSEADFYETGDPATLVEIYAEIAAGLVGSIATDVVLVERYNDEHFVQTDSLRRAEVQGNQIVWQIPFVGRSGRSVAYTLQPQALGWHQVSSAEGELTLTDNLDQRVAQTTLVGPRVLVLFPLWLLFIAPMIAAALLLYRLLQGLYRPAPGAIIKPGRRTGGTSGKPVQKKAAPKRDGQSVTHGRPSRPPKR